MLRHRTRALFISLSLGATALATSGTALAQVDAGPPPPVLGSCPEGTVGCARAAIAYDRTESIPVEFDIDTGWVPSGSPVQVRFRTALTGRTTVRAAGTLEGSWPAPMRARAIGSPRTGFLGMDYGVIIDARVRLHLTVGPTTYDWEGDVPYVPTVDFGARASAQFDPWAWDGVRVTGSTMRQHIADIPLTDAIIPIPGIEGGLSFDTSVDLATFYRSTRITFGLAADPITARNETVMAAFTSGPSVEYFPRLEGRVEYEPTVHILPSLYVSLLGRRWSFDIFDLPLGLPLIERDWIFDPSPATLQLPDVARREVTVDFGNVAVGDSANDAVAFESIGRVELWVGAPSSPEAPFFYPRADEVIAPSSTESMPVVFSPTEPGAFEQRVAFRTSDPDTPVVTVVLRGTGVAGDAGTTPRDAGVPARDAAPADGGPTGAMTGGCGCTAAGSSANGSSWALLGFAGLAVAYGAAGRRRRRAVA